MIKYILVGLGVLIFCAMAVGDGLGVMAFMKLRAASAAASAAQAKTTAKADGKSASKADDTPTAAESIFVEIPQFVVTIPAPVPAKQAGNGNGQDAAQSAGDDGDGVTPPAPVYLQLSLSFLTKNKQAAADFGKLVPMIKSGIISDIMSSNMSPNTDPVQMKREISDYSLQLANTIVSQADSKVGKTPFVGAYVTSFVTQ